MVIIWNIYGIYMASYMGECGESLLIIVKLEMVAVIISGYNHGIITSKSWEGP